MFGLCYIPEFLALAAVRDFLNPDFLLIGESTARRRNAESLYRTVCENRPPGVPQEPRQR